MDGADKLNARVVQDFFHDIGNKLLDLINESQQTVILPPFILWHNHSMEFPNNVVNLICQTFVTTKQVGVFFRPKLGIPPSSEMSYQLIEIKIHLFYNSNSSHPNSCVSEKCQSSPQSKHVVATNAAPIPVIPLPPFPPIESHAIPPGRFIVLSLVDFAKIRVAATLLCLEQPTNHRSIMGSLHILK